MNNNKVTEYFHWNHKLTDASNQSHAAVINVVLAVYKEAYNTNKQTNKQKTVLESWQAGKRMS